MNNHLIDKIKKELFNKDLLYEEIDVSSIVFNPSFRNLCEENKCGRYNCTWNCPPACGDVKSLIKKITSYDKVILIQKIIQIEDSFDFEGMIDGGENFALELLNIKKFTNKLYQGDEILFLGCESCVLCEECTYPDYPCRFPTEVIIPIEACGIDVCSTTLATHLKYYNGENTVTFFGMVIYSNHLLTMYNKKITTRTGDNLLRVLQDEALIINAPCGGNNTCGKCEVLINGVKQRACQYQIVKDIEIDIPSFQNNNRNSDEDVIDINNKSSIKSVDKLKLGLSIDLGTTTLVFHLVDLNTKVIIDKYSTLNQQRIFGSDVLTRINYCKEGKLDILNEIIINQITKIIQMYEEKYLQKIDKIYVSGNPTMLHILSNSNPQTLGEYPFKANFLNEKNISIKSMYNIKLLPSISSFVGSDITSGIIATKIYSSKGINILVDIGTNGEIILKTDDALYATSTAAGPAFEGANIECGLGGVEGAINEVSYDKNVLRVKTIGDKPAIGICGSGLIDVISLLKKENIIDDFGLINEKNKCLLSSHIKDGRFYITDNVYITNQDISEFQLAKSAIHSGIKVLMKKANIDNIDNLYIAGGFGFHMNIQNALYLGLIPHANFTKVVGNTSSQGTIMCLIDENNIIRENEIAKKIISVNLSNDIEFYNEFMNNMFF